jgi:co-chaperonin GroES (HSP10)
MDTTGLPVINPYGQGLDVSDREIAELFPTIDPEFKPFGHRVVVQIRRVVDRTSSGIILAKSAQESESYNGQVALLLAAGPLAFKNRATAEPWPEGVWASVGDFVKVPRWGGDRWTVDMKDGLAPVSLAVMADSDLIGAFTGDVKKVRAHLS